MFLERKNSWMSFLINNPVKHNLKLHQNHKSCKNKKKKRRRKEQKKYNKIKKGKNNNLQRFRILLLHRLSNDKSGKKSLKYK